MHHSAASSASATT
ncbi:hypothetical protein E2C01_091836 [Portunus trituberculatus]|uniref:Uncharacterized protein n=1 Tax=Portunus trituberculatus TaxID=210409 RepID=A0A5B7JIL8_PORTR|nr:hypothetical protein [Portunus trituberculatus]